MKPILFNTGMTRAILEGRKTVTRRVVKPQPEGHPVPMPADSCWSGYFAIQGAERVVRPPYQPGDVLWVRETWRNAVLDVSQYSFGEVVNEESYDGYQYKEDMSFNFPNRPCEKFDPEYYIVSPSAVGRRRPSIHMPREAARIFLRVTGVRAERLHEIATIEAQQEGQPECTGGIMSCGGQESCFDCEASYQNAIRWFSSVWDNTIKSADRTTCGWDANPWVWVIEFEQISKEEAVYGV